MESKETVASSSQPLLALKLGKRCYFEDTSNSKNSSLSMKKKLKSSVQNTEYVCCQVEGCGFDLSSAKEYYRKHRVCESHSKSSKVLISGLERRFCQQCSRFQFLEEFDEEKRSCRHRLSRHNTRRRKLHSQADQFNQSALSSSHYDGRQPMSPFAYSRSAMNLAGENINNSNLPETKEFLLNPAKANSEEPSFVPMLSDDPGVHFATNCINPDIEDSIITSSVPNVTQDFYPALSLLSTNSRDSYDSKSISLEHSNHTTSISHHMPASSEYWHTDHDQQVNPSMWSSYWNFEDSNHFQKFQPSGEPYESSFHQLD